MKILKRMNEWTGGLKLPVLALALILLAPRGADAVIVNSLRGFSDSGTGWTGGLGGSLGASGGNTEQTTLSTDARLQWRGDRDLWRVLGKAQRTSSGGIETARAVLGHLRHNHHLRGGWHTLVFLQLQENPFQRLNSRFLAGYGARWDIRRQGRIHSAIGAANMLERETIEGTAGSNTDHRLSMFASTVFEIREGVELDGLAFYQPRWTDMGDWRVFLNVALDVKLTGNLSLFSGLDLERDSRPPTGVDRSDWSTETGLRFSF